MVFTKKKCHHGDLQLEQRVLQQKLLTPCTKKIHYYKKNVATFKRLNVAKKGETTLFLHPGTLFCNFVYA
jgi:hypothetical protein